MNCVDREVSTSKWNKSKSSTRIEGAPQSQDGRHVKRPDGVEEALCEITFLYWCRISLVGIEVYTREPSELWSLYINMLWWTVTELWNIKYHQKVKDYRQPESSVVAYKYLTIV